MALVLTHHSFQLVCNVINTLWILHECILKFKRCCWPSFKYEHISKNYSLGNNKPFITVSEKVNYLRYIFSPNLDQPSQALSFKILLYFLHYLIEPNWSFAILCNLYPNKSYVFILHKMSNSIFLHLSS